MAYKFSRRRSRPVEPIVSEAEATLMASADFVVPEKKSDREKTKKIFGVGLTAMHRRLQFVRSVITPEGYAAQQKRLEDALQDIQIRMAELADVHQQGPEYAKRLNKHYDNLREKLVQIWQYEKNLDNQQVKNKNIVVEKQSTGVRKTAAQLLEESKVAAAHKLAAAMGISYEKAYKVLTV